jgi:hypothetical protein
MPFVDRSTLTYPATNSFPVRKWLDPARNPVSGVGGDFRSFQIFDIWINDANDTAWIMVDRTATSGTWVQMASTGTGILTITGDAGGAVGPDGANNINLLSGANITVTGNPGTNTLTITLDGAVAQQFDEDVGTAIPAAGVLNIVGGMGISTTGAGNTVTINAAANIPLTFTEDAGSATPVANNLNVLGGTGINTAGAGDTITINADASVALTYTADVGSATPAANNLNIFGAGSTTTSGAGSTITITSTGGGIAWTEVTVVGPTQMVNDHGYITNNASPVQLLLPLTSAIGSTIVIVGKGAGGWLITQNAGQSILLGASTTTVGVTGTVGSSEPSACIEMVCITADTVWRIRDSAGNEILT